VTHSNTGFLALPEPVDSHCVVWLAMAVCLHSLCSEPWPHLVHPVTFLDWLQLQEQTVYITGMTTQADSV